LLGALLKVRRSEAQPRGALDGINAFTWPCTTNTGMAFTVVVPWVIWIDTPPNVVCKGNEDCCDPVAGPMPDPKIVNKEPCAMEPAGKPGAWKLAAFKIECGEITGAQVPGYETMSPARKPTDSLNIQILLK
jgi:hypothetical protein